MDNKKKLLIAVGVVIVIMIIFRRTSSNKDTVKQHIESPASIESTLKNDSTKIVLVEEVPAPTICKSNVGKLKINSRGVSVGSKTELTELKKLLKQSDCDVIEVEWIWTSSTYDDMPKKIVYNRITDVLEDIYTRTNVIESYTGVDEKGLIKFLNSGKKSLFWVEDFTDATYDFNNREMNQTASGEKPSQSEWNGSVKIVKDYIKANAKDGSNIDFIEWSKVSQFQEYWIVRCKYKGTNSFGAAVTENYWFYIQNNKVVKTKDING